MTLRSDEVAAVVKRYAVESQDWLDLEFAYVGRGTATFSTNPGSVGGPTTVRYAEDGSLAEFDMHVEELTGQTLLEGAPDFVFAFIEGLPEPDSPGTFSFGPQSNECASLEVVGESFALRPQQRSPVLAHGGNSNAQFKPYRTVVHYVCDSPAHYWVAPLLNFVVDYRAVATSFENHPLRTRRTASYQPMDGALELVNLSAYQAGNALIPFLCEHEPAFIEPLADYSARRERVERGETTVTAVMVGRVPEVFDVEREDWFPADLVTLLGLSSGRSIGVPFVELRGVGGELVARMHVHIGGTDLGPGRPLIDEAFSATTGPLLTSFLASDVGDKVWFRVVLKHLLRALTGGGTVEDRLGHLFRAVEGTCAGLKLNESRPLEVDAVLLGEVEGKLADLDANLAEMAERASDPDRERISKLRNRLRTAMGNSPSFETQLLSLVQTVGLPDAEWLANFKFRARHNRQPTSWARAANDYRNRIVHTAFIDFEKFDDDNAFAFISHLSDVLVRVVFHLIGFVGVYRPPCGSHGAATYERAGWARPERLSAALYRYID